MARLLVTGGRGGLGRELVPRLHGAGHTVRISSRSAQPAGAKHDATEWARLDLVDGAGIEAAVAGIEVVVHAATSPFWRTRATDVEGTRRLLDASRAAGVRQIVYVSIVGIDRVPVPYYRSKLAAEALVRGSGIPYSILRATQFHSLLARTLEPFKATPLRFVPAGFQFQPVDPGEVAARLTDIVAAGPAGLLPDFGGPAVRTFADLTRAWAAVRGRRILLIPVPLPGAAAAAFRAGLNTCPEHTDGQITWEEYLDRHR